MKIAEAYTVLGLDSESSTPALVRSTFRKLILNNHPDVFQGDDEKQIAHERTVLINEAFATLEREGFPRLVREPHSSRETARASAVDEPDVGGRAESHKRGATSDRDVNGEWQSQSDGGDQVFDAWARDLRVGAYYGREKLRYGAPVAVARSFYDGAVYLYLGIMIFLFGVFAMLSPGSGSGVAIRGLIAVGFGVASIWIGVSSLIGPVAYYVRRKSVSGQQLSGATVSSWPHPERMPDWRRWLLLVPMMLAGLSLGIVAGALVFGVPALVFHHMFNIRPRVEPLVVATGGALMSVWAASIAPRYKILSGLASAALLIFLVFLIPLLRLLYGVPWTWGQISAYGLGDAIGGMIGVVAGLLLVPSYRKTIFRRAYSHPTT